MDDRFYKIVEARETGGRRQDLRGEFDLLRRCRGLPASAALELIEADGGQILAPETVPGRPLSRLELPCPSSP